jgi:hypothetical protein
MGCLIFLLAVLSARIALIFMWIFTNLVDRAFDSFIVPLLGVLFLPWTTLLYVVLWSPRGGVEGWEWIVVGLGLVVDIGSYGRGAMQRG